MAVTMFSGTVGSGKSLHTAREIKEKLRWGRNVISTVNIDTTLCFMNKIQEWVFNITRGKKHYYIEDVRQKNFYYIDILEVTPEYLYRFAGMHHVEGKERQTYLYLDECVAIFSPTCRTMQDLKEWEKWQTFFRMSRQLGYEIIIIPQSARLISRKVIETCEIEVKHFAQKHHGTFGFFLSFFLGGVFTAYTFWRGDKRKAQSQHWYKYKPLYGAMYNSYTLFADAVRPYKEAYQWDCLLEEEKQEHEQKQIYLGQLVHVISLRQQILLEEQEAGKRWFDEAKA